MTVCPLSFPPQLPDSDGYANINEFSDTGSIGTSTSSVTEDTNLFSVFYSKHRVLDLIRSIGISAKGTGIGQAGNGI